MCGKQNHSPMCFTGFTINLNLLLNFGNSFSSYQNKLKKGHGLYLQSYNFEKLRDKLLVRQIFYKISV